LGKTSIKYYIYSASRTGSHIKIGIHDSGGTTTEHTANISSTGAWEEQTWDISGVADANKDDIDSIIITVVNADAANTFYLDNMNMYGTTDVTLDMMEYSTSELAQAAYVSSDKADDYTKLLLHLNGADEANFPQMMILIADIQLL